MKKERGTLKSYFGTGDYPTEQQFADLIDSFLNLEDDDAVTGIADNGDGTYTFQLLSGGTVTLDTGTLPDNIPIANIVGLQAALDAVDPANFLKRDQDETTSGSLGIGMANPGGGKSFSVGAQGNSAYLSMDSNGWGVFGNSSANDGQNSHIVVKRNGNVEFNANGTVHKMWHAGNDGSGSGLDADTLRGVHWGNINVPVTISAPATTNPSLFIRNNSVTSTDSSGEATLQFGYSNHVSSKISSFKESTNSSGLKFYTEQGFNVAFERMYLAANGNLGVGGNLTAANRMSIGTTSTGIADLRIGYGRSGNGHSLVDLIGDTTYPGYGLRIQRADGGANTVSNIDHRGIGALRLRVIEAGSIEFHTSNAVRLTIASGGAATFSNTVTATNFILSSDHRLKTDISPISSAPLQVDWKTFRSKESPGQLRYGVVAQELEKNHPEFVSTDKDGLKSVAYIDLLVAKNAELESRIEKLEGLIKNIS